MLILAALILLFCGPWFADQHTVGLILLIPAAFEALCYVLAGTVAVFGASQTRKSFRR